MLRQTALFTQNFQNVAKRRLGIQKRFFQVPQSRVGGIEKTQAQILAEYGDRAAKVFQNVIVCRDVALQLGGQLLGVGAVDRDADHTAFGEPRLADIQ